MNRLLRTLAASTATVGLVLSAAPAGAQIASPEEVNEVEVTAQVDGVTHLTSENVDSVTGSRGWWAIASADPRVEGYAVYSPAMGRDIPVAVIPATNEAGERVANAPTLYLLNGAGGAEQDNDWLTLNPSEDGNVGTIDFYSGKSVNVVIPMAGAFSYYVNWVSEPNGAYLQGPQMWETFLNEELPGAIETTLQANDRRAILGFSMSATSAVLLAEHKPGFYQAVAGLSGMYGTSNPAAYNLHGLTLQRGGATPQEIFGPLGGEANRYNDALINAEGLRGAQLYFSNSSGLAGRTDQASYYIEQGAHPLAALKGAFTLQFEGGVIEGATNASTHALQAKLNSLGIPATFNFRNTGTHSWPSWREDIHESWPVIAAGLFG